MSNNRLYLVDPRSGRKVLLAKGWAYGWEAWNDPSTTLLQRLQNFFDTVRNEGRELADIDSDTELEIWTEEETNLPI
jgi:hypothetical protein